MSKHRVLLIDCQHLQTTALHRGMGKYTLAVLSEFQKLALPYDEIAIILSEHIGSDQDEALIAAGLKDFKTIRLKLQKTNPVKPDGYPEIAKTNRSIIDKYIDQNLSAASVDFLITSIFHEDGCSVFPTRVHNKHLLVYDLIPLQFPHYYLEDPRGKHQYLSRMKEFFEASHYFTISETVANDLSLAMGIPLDRITAINGSYISRKGMDYKEPEWFIPGDKFILMPTGDDARKNNLRGVIAFEDFNSKSGYAYKLIITSFFGDKSTRELQMQSNHIMFTGNVAETELAWLYNNAELILFPSEYEGLGMPPLEAVEFGKPVLCSDITVFKEITNTAFHFCDPYSVQSISAQLQMLLINDKPKIDNKEYLRILDKYQWSKTAAYMCAAFKEQGPKPNTAAPKKRIAVFAPNPSGYSAIGKVVQEQHYELSRMAEVDYFLEDGVTHRAKETNIRVNYLPYVASVANAWVFGTHELARYDEIIYHLGNSEYHVTTAVKALVFPGTVVLHDTNLSGMLGIVKNLGYISSSRYEQEAALQDAIFVSKGITERERKGSYIGSIVNASKRIITHSQYALEAVDQLKLNRTVISTKLNLPTPTPYAIYDNPREHEFTAAFAGIIHAAKGLGLVSEIAAAKYKMPLTVKLFGYSLIDESTKDALLRVGDVDFILSPSDTRFIYELGSSDVVIGFRPDYHGETSLSTLEALRLGKPVIVNDVGWFKEIPEGIVYKISNPSEIIAAIKKVMTGDATTYASAQARIEYIRGQHNIHNYVKELIK
jgi:glycosyltransferase involved in cell wall biosynthesis